MLPHSLSSSRSLLVVVTCAFAVLTVQAGEPGPLSRDRSVYQQALTGVAFIRAGSVTGSGWVVDRDSRLIVTNHHVVGTSESVRIYFPVWKDGQPIAERKHYLTREKPVVGTVIDSDPGVDLALIRLPSLPLTARALLLARESASPGDSIHSVGNPAASNALWVYTSGTVRAVYRHSIRYRNNQVVEARVIETQSPVNPGDSGGPVVNDRGELVGVTAGGNPTASLVNWCIDIQEVKAYLAVVKPLMTPTTARDFTSRGARQIKAGRVKRALADLNEALALDSRYPPAYYYRGLAHQSNKEHGKALEDFSRAIDLGLKTAVCYRQRAFIWSAKNEYDKALADLAEAIRLEPKDPRAYQQRALVWLVAKKDSVKALADLDRVVQLQPDQPSVYLLRAAVHEARSDFERAIKDCNKALEVAPGYLDALVLRGRLWFGQGQHDKAIDDYTQVIGKANQAAFVYRMRGQAWAAKKEEIKALADYDIALRLNPEDGQAYFLRGVLWLARRDHDRAVADLGDAIRRLPKPAAAYGKRGEAWLARREHARALEDFNETIRLAPTLGDGYQGRAGLWLVRKDHARALEDYNEAARLSPRSAAAHNGRAWVLATCPADSLRKPREAVEAARLACELTGWKNPDYLDTLAAACAASGDFTAAVKWQKKALEDPTFARRKGKSANVRLKLYQEGKPYRER
jgi:tetratricopeptide (TPR) repeat protein